MTMTRPAVAAENARRAIGRMLGAAAEAGVRDHVTFIVSVQRGGRPLKVMADDTQSMIAEINRQADIAAEFGYDITFEILPRFPLLTATADDLTVTR